MLIISSLITSNALSSHKLGHQISYTRMSQLGSIYENESVVHHFSPALSRDGVSVVPMGSISPIIISEKYAHSLTTNL